MVGSDSDFQRQSYGYRQRLQPVTTRPLNEKSVSSSAATPEPSTQPTGVAQLDAAKKELKKASVNQNIAKSTVDNVGDKLKNTTPGKLENTSGKLVADTAGQLKNAPGKLVADTAGKLNDITPGKLVTDSADKLKKKTTSKLNNIVDDYIKDDHTAS